MFIQGAIIFCLFSACAIAGQNTKMCLHCDHIEDPSLCTKFQACHLHDHSCTTRVRFEHGRYIYQLGCHPNHECPISDSIVGKRAGPPEPPHEPNDPHDNLVCHHCCQTTGCNAHLCGSYNNVTTTSAVTTPAQPLTTSGNGCFDIEDVNFKCNDFDRYNLCTAVGGLEYNLGHTRCRKHCGFCPDPCVDLEDANFRCSDYNIFHLCTAATGLAHDIAKKRCQKYCGFCGNSAATTTGSVTTTTTSRATTTTPAKTATTKRSVVTATAALNQGQSTQLPCFDTDASCTQWAAHGLCTMTTIAGDEISSVACRKSCGKC